LNAIGVIVHHHFVHLIYEFSGSNHGGVGGGHEREDERCCKINNMVLREYDKNVFLI
jgi:hypothetical protein